MTSTLKHFDYLVDHGAELEKVLGLSNLAKSINHWRCDGLEFPDEALAGCRKTIEVALKTLAQPLPDPHMKLVEVIDYAENQGIIDWVMAKKCHEIRNKGNLGVHGRRVKSIDAQMTLDLLDDFLRWCAESHQLVPVHSGGDGLPSDPIFIVRTDDEIDEMTSKARLAAALGGNKEIERKARAIKDQIAAQNDSGKTDLQKMEELVRQAEEIGASAAKKKDNKTLAVQMALFDSIERKIEDIKAEKQVIDSGFSMVNSEVERILSEHDFIQKLLQGGNQATVEQLAVMAFPRGSNTVTNILQIAGGAGTGKTLCLLAKLIAEVDGHGQTSLSDSAFEGKKALFVCFNRGLAKYVEGILARYENALPDIEVVSFDKFINQLVRKDPMPGFEHLARYAQDVRNTGFQKIIYRDSDRYVELLKEAQSTVAKRYPKRANSYYLDPSNEVDFEWLTDELLWIEARFASEKETAQRYPIAERVGRGSTRRPTAEIRRIILEIRSEFNRLLETNDCYTIEQATKRLLGSSNLPAYDAIAVDEVQDFSLLSVRLLLRFRRGDSTKVFLSGDENQKIYKRDFTWRELDESLRGFTITLQKNMRNTSAIRCFSERLLGKDCPHGAASDMVHIVDADDDRTIALLRRLVSLPQTTALISNKRGDWENKLQTSGIPVVKAGPGDIMGPGLYLIGAMVGKGLEFDNVVVDYTRPFSEDEEEEKRLRYVHFTRARRRLYIRYKGTPPKLLTQYYGDFFG